MFVRLHAWFDKARVCTARFGMAFGMACVGVIAGAASPTSTADAEGAPPLPAAELVVDNAGRGAWSPARRRARIAFDAVVDENTRNMAVFTADAKGGDRRCVTCGSAVPSGYQGMMDWLPDGRHLLVTAENEQSQHRRFNHPSFGIDNDLWLVSADGSRAERIWRSPHRGGGITGARVNRNGTRVVFAERVPTGVPLPAALRRFGAWGEDVWTGWQLHIADIDVRRRGEAVLRNHRVLQPNGPGFYETSAFARDGAVLYAHTPAGGRFSDDVWLLPREGAAPRNLTESPSTWEEHGAVSPDGNTFAFVSSRLAPELRFPGADNADLVTELFVRRMREPTAAARGVTRFNADATHHSVPASSRVVVSRISFAPDGRRVLVQVASRERTAPQLWVVDLPRPL